MQQQRAHVHHVIYTSSHFHLNICVKIAMIGPENQHRKSKFHGKFAKIEDFGRKFKLLVSVQIQMKIDLNQKSPMALRFILDY